MSATVLDMLTYRREAPGPEQQARERIRKQLAGIVPPTIIAQAQARALRAIATRTKSIDRAVNDVLAWAIYAEHPDLPPAA